MIPILRGLALDESELVFVATTAQGPGGQHVNRSQTRVEVRWNIDTSSSLDADQRRRLHERLRTRITREGELRVSSQKHRSQARNRDAAVERLVELVAEALHEDPARRATRPTLASRAQRVGDKKKRGDVKKLRRRPAHED